VALPRCLHPLPSCMCTVRSESSDGWDELEAGLYDAPVCGLLSLVRQFFGFFLLSLLSPNE
jgi:hypothetical protein